MTAAALAKRLDRIALVPDTGIRAAADAVIKIAEAEGGTITLGKKRRRVRLSAVARVKGKGNNVSVTVWGKPTGPWVWKTTGARGHVIPKRPPTAKKPRPMLAHGYTHPIQSKQIHHPGSHGHGAWRKVVTRAERVIPELFRDEVHKAVTHG